MAVINETNGQYYAGQQILPNLSTVAPGDSLFINGGVWGFDTTPLSAFGLPYITTGNIATFTQTSSFSNFDIFIL